MIDLFQHDILFADSFTTMYPWLHFVVLGIQVKIYFKHLAVAEGLRTDNLRDPN